MNKNVIFVHFLQDFIHKMYKIVASGGLTGFYPTQGADGMHMLHFCFAFDHGQW